VSIEFSLQEGILIDRKWLYEQGFGRSSVDFFIRSGKLVAVVNGIYRKPGPPLKWQNIVYSLSKLDYKVHVGHNTALQYHGYQHFLPLGNQNHLSIYSNRKLPKWLNVIESDYDFIQVHNNPFEDSFTEGLEKIPFGNWDWPIFYSNQERAFLEYLSTVTTEEEIQKAKLMFEGAGGLRPKLLQTLLEECTQIKAKRLFLWLAKRQNHQWYHHIDISQINLGSGKRQIIKNGFFDKDFMFTVPKEENSGPTESLF
jgi:hypothetical protein